MSLIHFPLRVSDDAEIIEADGSVLGHVVWHDNSPTGQWKQNADARAAEIVRRCNAHDELVAAAKFSVFGERCDCITPGARTCCVCRLLDVLAKAEAR